MSNLYDQEDFFNEYAKMARSQYGLEAAGDWPQFKALLPDVYNKEILDLGCGYGWHSFYLSKQFPKHITAIDGSQRMIDKAKSMHASDVIEYQVCNIEEFEYQENTYDLVISNLVLHYIEDLDYIYNKVYHSLKDGGVFLFNIEHPTFTSGVNQDWIYKDGKPLYFPIDNYYYPGKRETLFIGQTVIKYHHTLSQIINPLIQLGFNVEAIDEVVPPKEMMDIPGMKDEMRRPMMLIVKVSKKGQ